MESEFYIKNNTGVLVRETKPSHGDFVIEPGKVIRVDDEAIARSVIQDFGREGLVLIVQVEGEEVDPAVEAYKKEQAEKEEKEKAAKERAEKAKEEEAPPEPEVVPEVPTEEVPVKEEEEEEKEPKKHKNVGRLR
jgi:hypothetical protein